MDLYKKIQERAYIIAEMSGNHAGSKERALDIIRAAKEAGADCVKIQTYTPDTITIDCDNDYFMIGGGTWGGEKLYDLYGKAFTPWDWQPELKAEADRIGIDFLSTPFDPTSVDFLEEMGMEFYKIASFELVDIPLIKYIAKTGKPIIMSTGMASEQEIQEAVDAIREVGNNQLVLLKCSSAYPAIPNDMNLATMKYISEKFDVPTGLSDHSLGHTGALTAVALGAKVIEKHFCISRADKNPDSSFSMEKEEFAQMVKAIRDAERAIGTVSFDVSVKEKENLGFRRSLFVVKDIKAGEELTPDNIRSIRPGYGIKPKYYDEVIGCKANKDIKFGTPLSWDDIDK